MWGVTTEIDLTGRAFNPDYITAFAETIKNGLRPGVHTIKAASNRIDAAAAATFFDALREGVCQLEYVVFLNAIAYSTNSSLTFISVFLNDFFQIS